MASRHVSSPAGESAVTDAVTLPRLRTTEVRGHLLHLLRYRRALARRLKRPGPLDDATIVAVHGVLAEALPPA